MARRVKIDPRGGSVSIFGELVEPKLGTAQLKIDLWRRGRHPPPQLVHAKTVKRPQDENDYVSVPFPQSMIGKEMTWSWDLTGRETKGEGWRILLDVRQAGASVEGYPVEYEGSFDAGERYDELKVSESVEDIAGDVAFVSSYQIHKPKA